MDLLHVLESDPNNHWIVSVLVATILAGLIGAYLKCHVAPLRGKRLPPGTFGLPFVGESVSFLTAQKRNRTPQWVEERVRKYGPVFKTSILGSRMVVATGQAGNRFMFTGTDRGVAYNQPASVAGVLGKHSLFEISGARHKLIRGAITGFLKPESLQRFVGDMDVLVQQQLKAIDGKDQVEIAPLMKKVTFNVTCSTLFGLPDGKVKDELYEDFEIVSKGAWNLPLNFPGTTFHKAMKARARVCKVLSNLISTRRKEMDQGTCGDKDVISSFIKLRDENGEPILEIEILDIFVSLVIASHETTTILLIFFVRHLAQDPKVFDQVLQEQTEVLKAMEAGDGTITWSEIKMMKCTWRVAQEVMRFTPPLFGNFRTITKDTTFDDFDIPKGWKGFWVTSTHMDEKIFEEPEKFDPSRFDRTKNSIPPYTYVPFGAGPRICPGADFARTEALLIMHHLVTKYEWKQVIPDEPVTRDPLPYPAMGLPVKLFPRKLGQY